jgi:hypothetical protein
MSKKLLKEGTVRKFMKLANLSSFSNNFVNEKYDMDEESDPLAGPTQAPPVKEGGMAYEGEGLYEEEDALEAPGDDEEGMDLGDEDDEPMGDNEEVFKRVVQAIADELDVEVDLEDATGGEGDMDMDMGDDEGDMDMGDDEGDMDMGDEDLDDEGDDEGGEEEALNEAILNLLNRSNIQVVDDSVMTEALVKRVAARVARRLLKESL